VQALPGLFKPKSLAAVAISFFFFGAGGLATESAGQNWSLAPIAPKKKKKKPLPFFFFLFYFFFYTTRCSPSAFKKNTNGSQRYLFLWESALGIFSPARLRDCAVTGGTPMAHPIFRCAGRLRDGLGPL